jgi:hypothetical protein
MRKKTSKIQQVEVTALIRRPRHLEAMGVLTVEITHMERAISELLGIILGTHFAIGEVLYFTVNSGIARMDIVRNVAPLVLNKLPNDLKKVNKLIDRAKAVMGKRHAIIHSFWMLGENDDDIRREKLGEYRNKRIAVVSLTELKQQISDVQKLTNELYEFCGKFEAAHPRKVNALKDYW